MAQNHQTDRLYNSCQFAFPVARKSSSTNGSQRFGGGSLDSVHIPHIPLTQPLARPAAFPAAAREHFPDPLKSRKRAPACSIVCSFTAFGAQAPHNSPGALRAPDCLISLWFRGTSLIDGGKYTFCAPPQNRVPMHSSFVAYPQCFPIFPIYPSLCPYLPHLSLPLSNAQNSDGSHCW